LAMALAAPADADSNQSALVRSLWMLIADFFAAAIPIVPFGFLPVPQGRIVSAVVTTLLLVALGVGRAKIGGRAVFRTVAETVSIGVAAALAGVAIGVWISHVFT
jgi:vacuolar iron transporter family protein